MRNGYVWLGADEGRLPDRVESQMVRRVTKKTLWRLIEVGRWVTTARNRRHAIPQFTQRRDRVRG